jgi:hypothetical protein
LTRVIDAYASQCIGRPTRAAGVDQACAQKPRRLHRHADALANDRMGLGRRIANHQAPVRASPRRANAGLNRSTAEPRAFAPCASEYIL